MIKLFFIRIWAWIKVIIPWMKFGITEAKELIQKIKDEIKNKK